MRKHLNTPQTHSQITTQGHYAHFEIFQSPGFGFAPLCLLYNGSKLKISFLPGRFLDGVRSNSFSKMKVFSMTNIVVTQVVKVRVAKMERNCLMTIQGDQNFVRAPSIIIRRHILGC